MHIDMRPYVYCSKRAILRSKMYAYIRESRVYRKSLSWLFTTQINIIEFCDSESYPPQLLMGLQITSSYIYCRAGEEELQCAGIHHEAVVVAWESAHSWYMSDGDRLFSELPGRDDACEHTEEGSRAWKSMVWRAAAPYRPWRRHCCVVIGNGLTSSFIRVTPDHAQLLRTCRACPGNF